MWLWFAIWFFWCGIQYVILIEICLFTVHGKNNINTVSQREWKRKKARETDIKHAGDKCLEMNKFLDFPPLLCVALPENVDRFLIDFQLTKIGIRYR